MLNIKSRDGSTSEVIAEYKFDSFTYNDINEIIISGNPSNYSGKLCYIDEDGFMVGSGIIENYSYDVNTNQGKLIIYPLFYDMGRDFVEDGLGNRVVYYDDSLEDILEDIINQYIASTTTPLLYIKSKGSTGQNLKYTFYYNTFLEAYNILANEFLKSNNYIKIDSDGGITIANTGTSKILNYGNNVMNIKFEVRKDEIKNFVVFDNKLPDAAHILKEYSDATSISTYEKRVAYLSDSRIKYEETADEYAEKYLADHKDPKIVIENIITTDLTVDIFNKISVNNWDKSFPDNLYVISKTYIKGGKINLKVGTIDTRSLLTNESQIDSVNAYVEEVNNSIPDVPAYIQETYIDSVEVRSPTISGNTGLFTNLFRVGSSGIIISGVDKTIYSANYSAGSTGWIIKNDGSAEFNNVTVRGNVTSASITSSTININSNFTVDSSGNVRGNDFTNKTILFEKLGSTPSGADGKLWCEGNPTNKVLRGYFGGDTTNKQQVSMSRMQTSGSFDRTSGTTISVNTRFQPRLLIFNGFFENTSSEIYGICNGQAGSVSSTSGFCNAIRLDMATIMAYTSLSMTFSGGFIKNSGFNINFGAQSWSYSYQDALTGYSYGTTGIFNISTLDIQQSVDAFAKDKGSGESVKAYVSAWADTGLTITINVSSGWRLSGNYTIFG